MAVNVRYGWRTTAALILLICVVSETYAGSWVNTQVSQVLVQTTASGDRIYVAFQTSIGSDGCTDGATWYAINPNTAQGKNLYSMALLAKSTNAPVSAFTNGCDDIGRNVLGGLWMY